MNCTEEGISSKFIASVVKSIQTVCHSYVEFSHNIRVLGHIHINVDDSVTNNYILNEVVLKDDEESSTMFVSNSFHAEPPPKGRRTKKKMEAVRSLLHSRNTSAEAQNIAASTDASFYGSADQNESDAHIDDQFYESHPSTSSVGKDQVGNTRKRKRLSCSKQVLMFSDSNMGFHLPVTQKMAPRRTVNFLHCNSDSNMEVDDVKPSLRALFDEEAAQDQNDESDDMIPYDSSCENRSDGATDRRNGHGINRRGPSYGGQAHALSESNHVDCHPLAAEAARRKEMKRSLHGRENSVESERSSLAVSYSVEVAQEGNDDQTHLIYSGNSFESHSASAARRAEHKGDSSPKSSSNSNQVHTVSKANSANHISQVPEGTFEVQASRPLRPSPIVAQPSMAIGNIVSLANQPSTKTAPTQGSSTQCAGGGIPVDIEWTEVKTENEDPALLSPSMISPSSSTSAPDDVPDQQDKHLHGRAPSYPPAMRLDASGMTVSYEGGFPPSQDMGGLPDNSHLTVEVLPSHTNSTPLPLQDTVMAAMDQEEGFSLPHVPQSKRRGLKSIIRNLCASRTDVVECGSSIPEHSLIVDQDSTLSVPSLDRKSFSYNTPSTQRSKKGKKRTTWRLSMLLVQSKHTLCVPTAEEIKRLENCGLGRPAREQIEGYSYCLRKQTRQQVNNFVKLSFPNIPLEEIGFTLAVATKGRKLLPIPDDADSETLEATLGHGKLYVVPHSDILLPDEEEEHAPAAALDDESHFMQQLYAADLS